MRNDRDIRELRDTGESLDADFLSIDMEALLRKLPGHSFRSPHHYPVELVRTALVRGAIKVSVTVHRSRVEISDDGPPLNESKLEKLCDVFDSRKPAYERQAALAFFEDERGIDILAAFSPSPKAVIIETVGKSRSGARITFRRGAQPHRRASSGEPGTRITILRAEGNTQKERETLRDYCRHAGAEILMDGSIISRRPAPENELASIPLTAWANVGGGSLWIPDEGDVCRIWFMDHGIRWRRSFFPPRHGMVFEAAVECAGKAPDDFSERVREASLKLYRLIANEYDSFSPSHRDRVEELLFLHYRHTLDLTLAGDFRPFMVLDHAARMSLVEIKKRTEEGALQALRVDDDPGRYYTKSSTVLILTLLQWEFLVDHAGIRLSTPTPVPGPDPRPVRLYRWLKKKGAGAASTARLSLLKPVDRDELDEQETRLLDLISKELDSGRFRLPGVSPGNPIEIIMSDRGRSVPGRVLDYEGKTVLALFRHNRHIRCAARTLEKNPANIYMVLPMLTEGFDGWR